MPDATQLVSGESTVGTLSPKFCSWGQRHLVAQSLALAADSPQSLALTLSGELLNFPVPQIPYLQGRCLRCLTCKRGKQNSFSERGCEDETSGGTPSACGYYYSDQYLKPGSPLLCEARPPRVSGAASYSPDSPSLCRQRLAR